MEVIKNLQYIVEKKVIINNDLSAFLMWFSNIGLRPMYLSLHHTYCS
ncbi:hypothetical protein [Rickettsiales endosymbiont of Trichoplax sp. H2]|nr:hypothetical protein [Rickettsiales endosymbiont of Trichoplax sp. H2]